MAGVSGMTLLPRGFSIRMRLTFPVIDSFVSGGKLLLGFLDPLLQVLSRHLVLLADERGLSLQDGVVQLSLALAEESDGATATLLVFFGFFVVFEVVSSPQVLGT
jgi:hypothetical protein